MNNNQFQQLDVLSILSLSAQLSNMNKDENYHKIINQFFSAIDNEIKKLHEENKIIIQQNIRIIELLERRK